MRQISMNFNSRIIVSVFLFRNFTKCFARALTSGFQGSPKHVPRKLIHAFVQELIRIKPVSCFSPPAGVGDVGLRRAGPGSRLAGVKRPPVHTFVGRGN